MIGLIKSATARAVAGGLFAVLVAGLLLGAARLALPFADLFRAEAQGLLARSLGLDVRVGRLGVRLAGLVLQLTLRDVELLDPASGRTQLGVGELRLDLDLLATLRAFSPQVESLTLVGAHLAIVRGADGRLVLAGLADMQQRSPMAVTFFLGNGRFRLADSDVYWIDEAAGAPPLHFAEVQMRFDNTGERHRIGMHARLYGDPHSRLRLVGDLQGAPRDPAHWRGELYLHWQGKDPGPLVQGRLPPGLHLGGAAFELEGWGDWAAGSLTEALGRIDLEGPLAWREGADGGSAPLSLERLRGLLRWQAADEGWRLDATDLAIARGGEERPATGLGLHYTRGGDGGWELVGGIGRLDLAALRALPGLLPGGFEEVAARVQAARPGGELRDLRWRIEHHPPGAPRWVVQGEARGLAWGPTGDLPGARGLDLDFIADQASGSLRLDTGGLTLALPRLLPGPLPLDRLAGEVSWRRDPDGTLRIAAAQIAADNADARTRTRLALALPAEGAPFLDLQTDLRDGDAAAIRRYVSPRPGRERLAHWLERAFPSGRVPTGTLLFRGALGDFPFAGQEGRFLAVLGVADLALDYHAAWPPLAGVAGEVRFENRALEIAVSAGRLLDSTLSDAGARIPDLSDARAVAIQGTVEGPFADALRILAQTPLSDKFGRLAAALRAQGRSRVELDMTIPLHHEGEPIPPRVQGTLSWPAAAGLALADPDIGLTELGGKLDFSEGGLSAPSLAAKLWGVPLRIRIETAEAGAGAGVGSKVTRIQAEGEPATRVLAQRLPAPLWDLVKGQARLGLRLDFSTADLGRGDPPITFGLESDLKGVAVDLPAPLGKPAADPRPLQLAGRLDRGGLQVAGGYGDLGLDLAYGRDAAGKLQLTGGTLNLGGGGAPPPHPEGLHLTGAIGTLDLSAWGDWWADKGPGGDALADSGTPFSAEVQIQHLLLDDLALSDVRAALERGRDQWDAKVSARELAGTLRLPHRARREPILIQLDRLDLKGLLGDRGGAGEDKAGVGGSKQGADPRRVHTLDLRIDQLLWGDNPVGRATLHSEPRPDGLEIDAIALDGPLMTIHGQASWTQAGEDGQRTALALSGQGSDLGEFLRGLDYASQLSKAPVTANVELKWPGGPAQFAPAGLDGKASAQFGAGSLVEVEPGLGRLLGILDFGVLQRRLSLDFSDLFGRGYAFEKMGVSLVIKQGQAVIEDLLIEGPSASIAVTGSTDLVDRRFDQVVTVTPRIGTSIAVASAVAGGPLVGAAVLLVDRVSGGAVDKLGRFQYRVTGPWDGPTIRRIGVDGREDPSGDASPFTDQGRAGTPGLRVEKPQDAAPEAPRPAQNEIRKNLFLDGD